MSEIDYLEKLEQLICDESRIVTYKMLSKELKIHVNKAKRCLVDFLEKKENNKFKVYYFLAGFQKKSENVKCIKVTVVSEDLLEETKKNFTEVTSCHIYSVHKGKHTTMDEAQLYMADVSYAEQNKYSAIKHCGLEMKLSGVDIKLPVTNAEHFIKAEGKSCLPKAKETTKVQNGSLPFMTQNESEKKEQAKRSTPCFKGGNEENEVLKNCAGAKSSPEQNIKKGTLASLWQKKEDNSENSKKENTKMETKGKNHAKPPPKNNILSMFSRQAAKINLNTDKKIISDKPTSFEDNCIESTAPEIETELVHQDNLSKEVKNSSKAVKRKCNIRNSSQSSKLKTKNLSDDEILSVKKKRRRICTIEDSDSDSECEEEQDKVQRNLCASEDPVEMPSVLSDDSEEPIPPTPPVMRPKGKAKIWKTVQKTYQDEDGFFVTKTQKELVSASEESDEDPLKVKNEKVVIKESSPNLSSTNRKQASLTSFFKHK